MDLLEDEEVEHREECRRAEKGDQKRERDGIGSEGIINSGAIEKIFNLKINEITSPTIYNNSYTISKITKIIPVEIDSQENVEIMNTNIINNISDEIHNLYINHFSNKYNIKINNQLLDSLFTNNI